MISDDVLSQYDFSKPFVYVAGVIEVNPITNFKKVFEKGPEMLAKGGDFKFKPKVSGDVSYVQVLKHKNYKSFDPYDVEETGATVGGSLFIVKGSISQKEDKSVKVVSAGVTSPTYDFSLAGSTVILLDKEDTDPYFGENSEVIDIGEEFNYMAP